MRSQGKNPRSESLVRSHDITTIDANHAPFGTFADVQECSPFLVCVSESMLRRLTCCPGGPEELAAVWQETFINVHTALYEAYG
jgi:hypothetical protein